MASLFCDAWCSITSWNSYSPSFERFNYCVNTHKDLQQEIDKVLVNPENSSVRDNFLNCANQFGLFTLDIPNFGKQWNNNYASFEQSIADASCNLQRYQEEFNIKNG